MFNERYNTYREYSQSMFGGRAQKVSINAGFTCPNRDGSKGIGGCAFCNNSTFNPDYCDPKQSVTAQIERGIEFFKKYKSDTFLAYFQAYSNTYGDTQHIVRLYQEALSHPMIKGIVIGTRPDCVEEDLLDVLEEMNRESYVAIELGVESCYDETLKAINRGHGWDESKDAIRRIANRGIPVGVHLIMGLPGETKSQMIEEASILSELPVTFLKLHQLQVVKGSKYGKEYEEDPSRFDFFTAEEYIDFCIDFMERLSRDIVVERFISQAPRDMVLAPFWDIKNYEFVHKLEKRLEERDSWQGKLYPKKR
ncbi:MAG: TIGR01212 family radical SAM protein [Bacteroidales bacterium]|nr:TIGR01212 family radical SAM protein [Bacteroidales bacterium]